MQLSKCLSMVRVLIFVVCSAFHVNANVVIPISPELLTDVISEKSIDGPVLISSNPADDSRDFNDSQITLTFDRTIARGTRGAVSIIRASDDRVLRYYNFKSTLMNFAGQSIILDPGSVIVPGEKYYILISDELIKDANGFFYAGIQDKTTLNFSTEAQPSLTESSPSFGQEEFLETALTFTFDKTMIKGSGLIQVINATSMANVLFSTDVSSSRVSIDGNVVTVDMLSPLPLQERAFITIAPTAFLSEGGSAYKGIEDRLGLRFNTISLPKLVSSVPVHNQTDFNESKITLTFDRPIFKGDQGRIAVVDAATNREIRGAGIGSNRVSIDGNVLTLDLIKPLAKNTSVYLKVPGQVIKDAAGSEFSGLSRNRLKFTTLSTPLMVDSEFINNVEGVDNEVSVTFNMDVFKGKGRVSLLDSEDDTEIDGAGVASPRISFEGNKMTFKLRAPISVNKSVYLKIPALAVKSNTGENFEGVLNKEMIRFSTYTALSLLRTDPIDEQREFISRNVSFYFDKKVEKGSGNIVMFDAADDSEIASVDVTSGNVKLNEEWAVVIFPNALPDNTEVYIQVPSTAFQDSEGNFFEGIQDKTTLNLSSRYRFDVATGNPLRGGIDFEGSKITLSFNNEIVLGAGRITVQDASDKRNIVRAGVGSERVTVQGRTLTFDLLKPLPLDTKFRLIIGAQAIKDPNGNRYNPIGGDYNFFTKTTPKLLDTEFINNDPLESTRIELTFDRDVFAGIGRVSLMDEADDSEIFGSGVSGSRIVIVENKVTISLPQHVEVDKFLYLKIPQSALKDGNDIFYRGALEKSVIQFTTFGFPQLRSSDPLDEAIDVTSESLRFYFDRDIQAGEGDIVVYNAADDSELVRESVDRTTKVRFKKNYFDLELTERLPVETEVYVNIGSAAVKDSGGKFFAGIQNNTSLNFTTIAKPRLVSTYPVNGEMDAEPYTVKLTFDQDIQRVASGRIGIYDASDDSEIGFFNLYHSRMTFRKNELIIRTTGLLELGQEVYVLIMGKGLRGPYDNYFDDITDKNQLRFTVIREFGLISSNPSDDALDFNGNKISLTFNRNVVAGAGRISVLNSNHEEVTGAGINSSRISINGAELVFDLINPLPAGQSYYLRVPGSAIKDMNGKDFSGILDQTTLNFSTAMASGAGQRVDSDLNSLFSSSSEGAIILYPNPATKELFIELGVATKGASVQVLNVSGTQLYQQEQIKGKTTLRVDVSSYTKGMYIALVRTANGIVVRKKFMINR